MAGGRRSGQFGILCSLTYRPSGGLSPRGQALGTPGVSQAEKRGGWLCDGGAPLTVQVAQTQLQEAQVIASLLPER